MLEWLEPGQIRLNKYKYTKLYNKTNSKSTHNNNKYKGRYWWFLSFGKS